jgi:hypothetical protein
MDRYRLLREKDLANPDPNFLNYVSLKPLMLSYPLRTDFLYADIFPVRYISGHGYVKNYSGKYKRVVSVVRIHKLNTDTPFVISPMVGDYQRFPTLLFSVKNRHTSFIRTPYWEKNDPCELSKSWQKTSDLALEYIKPRLETYLLKRSNHAV